MAAVAGTLGTAALGGAFGGKGGEERQSRNEQSTNNSSSAPWEAQIPYLLEAFKRASGNLNVAPPGQYLNTAAAGQLQKTLNGDYLYGNPESQKAIDAITTQTTNRVMPGIDSKFAAGGRYGSGLHKQALGQQIADTSAGEMAKNYANERSHQINAVGMAPGTADAQDWESKRLRDFMSIIGQNYGGTTTGSNNSTGTTNNPNNKLSGKIGGAMGGANLGRQLFRGNPGAGGVPGARLPTPRFGSGK